MTLATQPKLLLLSTHPHFIYLIERYSERSGRRVSHAATVDSALESLLLERPTMLLLHLGAACPDDGWATLRQLQENCATGNIPITVVSALADESRARAEGAAYWLWQPVMYADFLAVLAAAEAIAPGAAIGNSVAQGCPL